MERQILTLWISCCGARGGRRQPGSMTSAYRWNVGVSLPRPGNFLVAICASAVNYSVVIYASPWRKRLLMPHLRVCTKWKNQFGRIIKKKNRRRRNGKY